MLASLREVLPAAQKQGYAVGLFNAVNLEMGRAVLRAAESQRSPVILGPAEILLHHCTLEQFAGMLLPDIRRSPVPVVLHFDHGYSLECIAEALRCGFSSVMLDRSRCSLEQNIADTREVVWMARAYGASVEAEVGHVGSGAAGSAESAAGQDHGVLTEPEAALHFAGQTGVDALAVAIGTAHGPYLQAPKLDIARLQSIRARVHTPLVLHGGSGLSDDDFRNCIDAGISKVNIFTENDAVACEAARQALAEGAGLLTELLPRITQAVQQSVEARMRLFGSAGRA